MDISLIMSLIAGGLILSDEIITEYFIKYGLGKEGNPLMRNKAVRIISVPISFLGLVGLYNITKHTNPLPSSIAKGGLAVLIGIFGTVIGTNLCGMSKSKKLINQHKKNIEAMKKWGVKEVNK